MTPASAYSCEAARRRPVSVAFDTETFLVTPGNLVPQMVCATWTCDGQRVEIAKWDDPALEREFASWLNNDDIEIVGANVPYDTAQIVRRFPDLAPAVWQAYADLKVRDVLTEQKLQDIARGEYGFVRGQKSDLEDGELEGGPYALQSVYHRHSGLILPKDTWRLRYSELYDVPLSDWPADAVGYAKDDAQATWILGDLFSRNDPKWDILGDSQRQAAAKWWLYLTSAWGFPTDPVAVSKFEIGVLDHVQRLQVVLCHGALPEPEKRPRKPLALDDGIRDTFARGLTPELAERFSGYLSAPERPLLKLKTEHGRIVGFSRDTKAAKERMLAVHAAAGTAPKLTDTGLAWVGKGNSVESAIAEGYVSLDEEACRDSCDDVLGAYAEFTSLAKVAGTDIPILRRGLIQSRFEEIQDTGRTGSSKPNIQNLPRFPGVRECYVARPGFVLVDCDFDILELRTLGQICLWVIGASVLAEKLNAGEDPHMYMGAALAGVEYATARLEKAKYKDWRQRAKPVNFGVPGGMGAAGLRAYAKSNYGVVLTLEEASRYRELYLDTWPEVREYFRRLRKDLHWRFDRRYGGDVTDICHFKSGRYRGRVSYTKAANSYFQGLAADFAKACGFRISRECYDPSCGSVLFGCRIVNFIHDQYIVEAPEERAHECAMRVGWIMRDESRNWIPDVPATTTPALSRRFSKATEAVYVAGRLVPYEDSLCACGKVALVGDKNVVDKTRVIADKKGVQHAALRCAA